MLEDQWVTATVVETGRLARKSKSAVGEKQLPPPRVALERNLRVGMRIYATAMFFQSP